MTDDNRNRIMASFVRLFQNQITIEDEVVPILTKLPPEILLPSIIISVEDNAEPPKEYAGENFEPLPIDDPNYDPTNPDEPVNKGILFRQESKRQVKVKISAKTSDSRNDIQKQVEMLIFKAKHFHYCACLNYDILTDICSSTDLECDAIDSTNRFAVAGKCPYTDITDVDSPYYRDPKSVFHLSGIMPGLLRIKPERLDEYLDVKKEIYVVDIPVEFSDAIEYNTPANPICSFKGYETFIPE